ncbi:MAG TPA: hypothetical protein VEP66_05430 [Myxococcales bacterium]|nr:hypothetical protein [Myxococcales bacterium]
MADGDSLSIRRAAGAVLRVLKRRGAPPQRPGGWGQSEPLRPALAIDALLTGMGARFGLAESAVNGLLRPALADWRDAVGCADPLLVPANAQGPAAEKALLPLPMPSWCAWLIDAGVLLLEGPPHLDGPRVVQRAWLAVVRETELAAVECFPLVFAGRYGSVAASLRLHLALSPPFPAADWRGEVWLRAAARRASEPRAPVRIWLGAPASPVAPAPGARGQTTVTWVMPRSDSPPTADWPAGWPRWAVLRVLEGREPQALWDLPAIWQACTKDAPEAGVSAAASPVPGTLRLAVDIGSTSTVAVEEDNAAAGSIGAKLLPQGAPRPSPSGFRRIAGDAASAHEVGCADHLLAPGEQLPTALSAASPEALVDLLTGAPDAAAQLWLPQASESGGNHAPLLIDRFKSPELLLLSDWLADVPQPLADRTEVSRRLLETYAFHLGRTLAAAHGTPLVTPEGGRWTLRRPNLSSAEAVLTYPECAFDSGGQQPFRTIFDGVGRQLCAGLSAAWATASHRLVTDPLAARSGRARARDDRHPLETFVDFGGLTLQVTVRLPQAPGRPLPFVPGSSMSYLLGGERLIDAAAFASADRDAPTSVRSAYRATARRWRALIAGGGALRDAEGARHGQLGEALLETVIALVRRQLEGTLRRAAPDLTTLRGAGVRLHLLGEGWKLIALDVPDERREKETLRRIEEHLARRPLLEAPLQIQRMTKRRVCEGALRVRAAEEPAEPALELQGVDVASGDGLVQRWFGIAGAGASAEPDLSPHREDSWWSGFSGGSDSLLRVEQWFSGGADTSSPFQTLLAGGNLAFDGRRSVLKQWLDVSGPSLVALRIRRAIGR